MCVENIIYQEYHCGDGTAESLNDKLHRPLGKHPTAHTDEELKWIKDLIRRNSHITLNEKILRYYKNIFMNLFYFID